MKQPIVIHKSPVVSAVSYLNTVPLVWGFEKTSLGQLVNLEYALPSACADRVCSGQADLGILPVVEIARHGLDWLPSTGIACRGPVRSILLVSKVSMSRIQTLAADVGSRTSVMLARVLLAERFGCEVTIKPARADLGQMLSDADAALIIGDPALLLDPVALSLEYEVWDLGEQWWNYTGLPMVFALWAGRKGAVESRQDEWFRASLAFGLSHLDDILEEECPKRQVPRDLGYAYLTRHIAYELAARDLEGMQAYLKLAAAFDNLRVLSPVAGNVAV
ncbi:MAG: menaquinone biosynthesis protein [Bryobacteraceae bacterium]|nr:menaquinone biosynthesis protein [Bryobacteraceae bacterium]MDW8376578.1 menaquinone biosynthesis protein [Bryobacterales bacterium]